jgi:hypothetical protein
MAFAAPSATSRPLPPGVKRLGDGPGYDMLVYKNVMIMYVTGEIDTHFLRAALAAHHAALAYDPTGYGVVTMVASSGKIPPSSIRDEAAVLREKTQHMLRAQSVLISGEGFFASTMRAVVTGIITLARSRVPLKMAADVYEAAAFVTEKACKDCTAEELARVLSQFK